MARRDPEGPDRKEHERISRELLRSIGESDPFADADPKQVEERLRSMSYGTTNSRISKLRRAESKPSGDE